MGDGPSFAVSHVGLCVEDLARSIRFYCDGLGFDKAETHLVDDTFAEALELGPGVDLTSQFIRRDGMAIELMHYRSPAATGQPSSQRNQVGLTHLSFVVDDVDEAVSALEHVGGTLIPATRTTTDGVDLVFVRDPDGVRVELMAFPAGA
jgi:catechol 2,3-dioxygenase-like lactoylglutathione lyase family enzyme